MTLMAVERIKLTSTKAPWLCALLALALTAGFATMYALKGDTPSIATSQLGTQFGLVVVMVLAALSVTTEYRTGTIRTTFQAVPNRLKALGAKTATVAILAGIIGEITAFASYAMTALIAGDLPISTATEWRQIAGTGLFYAFGAVIAIAVGILLRHTAGTLSLLLVYVLLAEKMIQMIPKIGTELYDWAPFHVGQNFISNDVTSMGTPTSGVAMGPWGSLLYFAAFAVILLAVAFGVARKRDA